MGVVPVKIEHKFVRAKKKSIVESMPCKESQTGYNDSLLPLAILVGFSARFHIIRECNHFFPI
jgi:hypothetical protein